MESYTSESGLAIVTIGEIIERDKLDLVSFLPIDPANNDKVETLFQKPKIPFWDDNNLKLVNERERLKTREQSFSHHRSDNKSYLFTSTSTRQNIILYVKRLLLWGISTNYEAMRWMVIQFVNYQVKRYDC